MSNDGGLGKTSYFVAKCVNISKAVGDTSKVTRKLHMRFRLTPRSMTLDDLEISLNFQRISRDFADFGCNNS